MDDLGEDFHKFHDKIILENIRLRSKVEALEDFVKSIALLLFSDSNYNQLLKEYLLKDSKMLDSLLRHEPVYDAQALQGNKNDYINDLRQKIEKLK